MKALFSLSMVLALLLVSCNSPKEEAEIDYDEMVRGEPKEEWTSESKAIASDIGPDAQEVVIFETEELR